MKKVKKSVLNFIFDILELGLTAFIIFVLVNIFLGQLLSITGDSMLPNFEDGEQIIAEKVSVNFKDLQRGEVVIFKHPTIEDRLVIKRVVGLPKETFKIANGDIFINDEELIEPYVYKGHSTQGESAIKEDTLINIPKDSYILLGDNRKDSADSREWGPIPKEDILGRGLIVYYPLNKIRLITH